MRLVLDINNPSLDSVNLYLPEAGGRYGELRNGNLSQPADHQIQHLAPAFPLDLKAGQNIRAYLSVQSLRSSLFMPVVLHERENFRRNANRDYLQVGAFLGLPGIILCHALMLLFATRQVIYAYFTALIFFFVISQLILTGMGDSFLWSADGWINRTSLFYVRILYMIALNFFTLEYLGLKDRHRFYRYAIHLFSAVAFSMSVAYAIAPESKYPTLLGIQNLGQLAIFAGLFIISLILAICGSRQASIYLIVWGIFIAGVMGRTLMMHGVLPQNAFLVSIFFFGGGIGITILSLSLATQVNSLQKEKVLAQNEAIENKQKAIESLTQLSRFKDDFLAHTSHELRTPLQGIMGLTESLLNNVSDPSVRENADLIMQSARRLSHLIDDILDYSQMKERNLNLNLSDLDLRVQVEKVIRSLEFVSKNKGVPIFNKVRHEAIFVRADEQRLQQILFNIVGNALKYTAAGSISIDERVGDNQVEVSISDTGPGIAADQITEIFQRFGRINGGQTRGTGLGLTITKSLVELHGGHISVQAVVNEGSIFSFTMPLGQKPSEPKALTRPASIPEKTAGQKSDGDQYVLIVDDDPFIQRSTAEHLRRRGFEVALANDGASARQYLERSPPPCFWSSISCCLTYRALCFVRNSERNIQPKTYQFSC